MFGRYSGGRCSGPPTVYVVYIVRGDENDGSSARNLPDPFSCALMAFEQNNRTKDPVTGRTPKP